MNITVSSSISTSTSLLESSSSLESSNLSSKTSTYKNIEMNTGHFFYLLTCTIPHNTTQRESKRKNIIDWLFAGIQYFPPVEKSLIHQGTYIMNVFFLHTGYMHNLIPFAFLSLPFHSTVKKGLVSSTCSLSHKLFKCQTVRAANRRCTGSSCRGVPSTTWTTKQRGCSNICSTANWTKHPKKKMFVIRVMKTFSEVP